MNELYVQRVNELNVQNNDNPIADLAFLWIRFTWGEGGGD